MKASNTLYDPGLHLFIDDADVQDHPGFTRMVQRPDRLPEPVLRGDQPWEGAVQLWGSVLYDEADGLFKMWYYSINSDLYQRTGTGHFLCYATSTDGVEWEKPELGIVSCEGSSANNIVYPPPEDDWGLDMWGVVLDPEEQDPARRFKLGMYQQRDEGESGDMANMSVEARNRVRKKLFVDIQDRHGMYSAFSPDGIHWISGEEICVSRGGDAGTLVYDPMHKRYIATTRRYNTITDHFVLEWKTYRRVIAMATSEDFDQWTPLETVLKPDDFDEGRDQIYVMTPFVYGHQYLGFMGMLHTDTELGPVQLASARDLAHWQRVGRREEFMPVGAAGSWDGAWASLSGNPPVRVGDELYMWYSGRPQAHGTQGSFSSSIGMAKLRKDGFVALRCGIRGAALMTEPVEVIGPKLFLNAISLYGKVRVRVIDDFAVAEGYDFDDCNGLENGDETDCEVTWGGKDLSPFVGRKIRLHIEADNATSLFSYRFGN